MENDLLCWADNQLSVVPASSQLLGEGSVPTPGNPCFDLPSAALLLLTAPG